MDHPQNSHGIIEDGPPLPPGLKEDDGGRIVGLPGASPGTTGSTLFPGLFPPPAASDILAGLPGSSSPDRDRYFSRLLGEQSEKLKELERQKQMLGGGSPHKNNGVNGSPPSSSSACAHTCSLCGEGFPEVVALQVHIIKSHGAFPPEIQIPGVPPPGGSTPSTSAAEDSERRESDAKMKNSDNESDREQAEQPARMARTSSGPPTSAAPSPVTMTVPPAFPFPGLDGMPQPPMPPTSEASKQFPHIEMLQRHMLSQQFPNIMAPFLGGLPGFPNPGSAAGPFPNPLQHFLSGVGNLGMGNPAAAPASEEKKTEPETCDSGVDGGQTDCGPKEPLPQAPKKVKSKKNKRVKLFKCSKCGKKYPRREICLNHIQKAHGKAAGTAKLLSPLKSRRSRTLANAVTSNNHRSHYVRQLMELLRVPTSRGTPQVDSKMGGSKSDHPHRHIMQPFLLKTPGSPMAHRHPSSEDQGGEEDSGNDTCEAGSGSSTGGSGSDININFVPSLVYLPVGKRISEPITVAFNLTPA